MRRQRADSRFPVTEAPLAGIRIVVCRPRDQAAPLTERLEAASAEVVFAPVIAIVDPPDDGAELRMALASLTPGDWLVLTSPNGAARAAAALDGGLPEGVKVAVVGPGTAEQARAAGLAVDLIPGRSIAEGLLEVFPAPGADGGRVVLARAEVARDVLPVGLRKMGWQVADVAAYRTVAADLDPEQRWAVAASEVVLFTSSSTVKRLVAQVGVDAVPPVVVSIGPATSAAARDLGLEVTVEAAEHSVPGVVEALVDHAASWGRNQT
jgi:uroporphyrinogen-III synthase